MLMLTTPAGTCVRETVTLWAAVSVTLSTAAGRALAEGDAGADELDPLLLQAAAASAAVAKAAANLIGLRMLNPPYFGRGQLAGGRKVKLKSERPDLAEIAQYISEVRPAR
jgi:hypothetical protein